MSALHTAPKTVLGPMARRHRVEVSFIVGYLVLK